MTYYVPGTDETDLKKVIMSLQQVHANTATNTTSIAAHEAAWTAYTPTLTASVGTYTSASATGRYKTIGKTVFVNVLITITTVGTGTYPEFTLPVTPRDISEVLFYGSEQATTAKTINGRRFSATTVGVAYYDNSMPAASGAIFRLTGVYEAA